MSDPLCWQCRQPTVPNYRAKAHQHPCPDNSRYCKFCKHDLISCDDCQETGVEWWFELGEIWEDFYYSDYYCLCESCYETAVEKDEISDDDYDD